MTEGIMIVVGNSFHDNESVVSYSVVEWSDRS